MERCGLCYVIKIPQIWPMYKVLTKLKHALNMFIWIWIFGSYALILSMLILFQLQPGLVLLGLQFVIPAQNIPVLLPSAAGLWIMFPVLVSSSSGHWGGGAGAYSRCCSRVSSAVPLQTVERGLGRGLQILSDKLLTNFRSNFPGINCRSDKWKWHCHVSTRQHWQKS